MKLLYVLIAACILVLTATAYTFPAAAGSDELKLVSSFEGGERCSAGPYDVLVLSGSYREMGRQYGSLMKDELLAVYDVVTENAIKNGYAVEELHNEVAVSCEFQPKRMKEIYAGMAETSGLTEEDIRVIYYGPVIYLCGGVSCSFLAAWGDYTPDGMVVLSRNWDLSDSASVFDPYYVLVVYNPSDGSNGVATFGPAGTRPETLMNSEGLFIANDNDGGSGGYLTMNDRPDLISEFFRFMLDYSTLKQLDAGIMATRTDTGWIVNAAGPEEAYSYEETVWEIKRRDGNGIIAATNHFADPAWNFAGMPAENSLVRYNNLFSLADKSKGSIDASEMMNIRDILIDDGGARFLHYNLGGYGYSTDHQVVFVPETRELRIRVLDSDWQKVELATLFKS
ncbi:C45 family autoproteolytic acyltransferase/hydolase [Methanoplanus endosymbiosus]|uniref:C45 family autoproteolytic acyltransferase/hydrolase n=1 Tax=Methanoplanus endosymbiosus TaxID=33865 RepID=A0A9E7PJZ2_9EURY|nr:C45 family peptidase [Methanoplanus endosymbiosus]UUX91373.1 C45 family autoproteolytic acyltransferase/hydrolase [Methanoplanus endosymbiosus]